jgi:scyllo-inositol 2-dehydrogenase (NADP+)
MTNETGVGLIGYGLSGRVFHAPIIQSVPQLKLKTVVQRHAGDAREKYPSVTVVQDAAAVFADQNIDLVVITTPNNSHFDLARKALLANKHVVVEKPFTNTANEATQLIEIARRANLEKRVIGTAGRVRISF